MRHGPRSVQGRQHVIGRRKLQTQTAAGRPAPPPQAVKYDVIRAQARKAGIRQFVETGTWRGDSVFNLRRDFAALHSIELSPELYRENARKLRHISHIHLYQGDSASVLPNVAAAIAEPTLFWLDGHFSGSGTAKGRKDTPVFEELEWLLKRAPGENIVLIDDARLFTGEADYPTLEQIAAMSHCARTGSRCFVENDIIHLVAI